MTLEHQVHNLELRVRKLEQAEKNRQTALTQQEEFENKRDEIMNDIGHDM